MYNKGFATRKISTDARAINKIAIPLNIYSYFTAVKNNLNQNINMNILIRLAGDHDVILRSNTAADSKVIVKKFRLCFPKIIFNGSGMKQYLENYQHGVLEGCAMYLCGLFQQLRITARNRTFSLLKH